MAAATRSPLQEDSAACMVAASLGFELVRRRRGIEITDERVLKAAGLTITATKPDYKRIAQMLEAGEVVAGACFSLTEYVMRPTENSMPVMPATAAPGPLAIPNPDALEPMYLMLRLLLAHPAFTMACAENPDVDSKLCEVLRLAEYR